MTTTAFPSAGQSFTANQHLLANALGKRFVTIVLLYLSDGFARILKSETAPSIAGQKLPWAALLRYFAECHVCEEERASFQQALCFENLDPLLAAGTAKKTLEVRCTDETGGLKWIELAVSVTDDAEKILLITARDISKQKFLQSIVSQFLYRKCDYLALLDARRDTYTIFGVSESGVPVPTSCAAHYTSEMQRFNKQYIVPEDEARVTANMQLSNVLQRLETEEEYTFTCGMLTEKGNYCRICLRFSYYDKPAGLVLLLRTDITLTYLEEKAWSEQLVGVMREAQTDALTGLYNKKTISNLIARYLTRQDRRMSALLFIDVDNFKQVNDTLGHLKGDEFLRALANAFKALAGPKDLYGRIGGDEFLFYLPDVTREAIEEFAACICGIFDALDTTAFESLPVSCSVGIAVYPQDGTDYETLVDKADQALYTAKRYGKNTYYFYSESMSGKRTPSLLSIIDKLPGPQ